MCGRCNAVFETMYDLSSHMTRFNCDKANRGGATAATTATNAATNAANKKSGDNFVDVDNAVDSFAELLEDEGEGEKEEHKSTGAKGEGETAKAAAEGGDGSPDVGGQR